MENLIDWKYVSENFGELRRNIGQAAIVNRISDRQPPAKKRRVDPDLDVTLCPEKFPSIDETNDSMTNPARYLIDSGHAKIFVAAIQALIKFSDSVLLCPTRDGLTVRACNLTRTAAGTFNFFLDFFGAVHTYDFPKEKPCCRIFLKPFMIVLKKTEALKQLDNFVMDLDPDAETMIFRVLLRNGIKKVYKLPLTDVLANSLPKLIQRDSSLNFLVMMARPLSDALEIVGKDMTEIGFWASNHDILFHTLFQVTQTNAKWRKAATRISDYINAQIRKLVTFSFHVRDIRALCRFADKYNSSISMYFKTAKHPLFVVAEIPGLCEATFTVSTNVVYGTTNGETIRQMIPEIDVNVPIATQSGQNTTLNDVLTSQENQSMTQFAPVEINQSHPRVQAMVNDKPDSYWRAAIAVRELEVVELP